MICASVVPVAGAGVTAEDAAGRAVSGQSFDDGFVVVGRVGTGRAVSGQSFDDCDFVAGRAVSGQSFDDGFVVGRVRTGRAVSGQSFDDCDFVVGRAVSGQSFDDGDEGDRVVAAGRLGAGGGSFAAFSRAVRAAALFGSKRGGSVGFLT
jgi:hypothetical protein